MVSQTRLAAVAVIAIVMLGTLGCGKQPIATVGGEKITRAAFLEKLESDQGREALLGMIHEKLVEDAFTQAGLSLTDAEIEENLDKIRQSMGSPEVFSRWMKSQGMTEEDLLTRLTLDLKMRALCTKDVKVTEEGLKQFYEQNKERFYQPSLLTYRELVVASEEEAKKVAAELAKPQADFGKLAKQHSISPASRDKGGEMPAMPLERVYPEAVQALLGGMKAGQMSDPVDVGGRWYIIKLEKIDPEKRLTLSTDRDEIEKVFKLQSAKQGAQLVEELRQKASVTVIDPKYKDIQDMFSPKEELPSFGGPTQDGAGAQPPAAPEAGKPAEAPEGGQ